MTTRIRLLLALSILTLPFITLSSSFAQDPGAPPAIYKAGAEIDAELDAVTRAGASSGGASVLVAPGVNIRRRVSGVTQYAVLHPYSVEIYRILEGSGTLVTGGKLILPLAESNSEDLVRTLNGVEGGLARKVKAGDVLVLQPGTPHWFQSVDGESITYMESRIRISTHSIMFQ